jgi:hypothetical protein
MRTKIVRVGTVLVLALYLSGCASKHAYMSEPFALGPDQWQCDLSNHCELVQMWQPSQLTPLGCAMHTLVTGGHIAWECRKPKNGKVPSGGRWIWRSDKSPVWEYGPGQEISDEGVPIYGGPLTEPYYEVR